MDSGFDKTRGSDLKPPHARGMDTREMLAHARRQSEKRKLDDYYIVDVDAHHYENQSWSEVLDCMPNDVIQFIGRSFTSGGQVTPGLVAVSGYALNQPIGGRIVRGFTACWRSAASRLGSMPAQPGAASIFASSIASYRCTQSRSCFAT